MDIKEENMINKWLENKITLDELYIWFCNKIYEIVKEKMENGFNK